MEGRFVPQVLLRRLQPRPWRRPAQLLVPGERVLLHHLEYHLLRSPGRVLPSQPLRGLPGEMKDVEREDGDEDDHEDEEEEENI